MRITLKAARVNKEMTQNELAIELGVTKKTVWAWENGKSIPRADKIDAICALLGLKYDDIQWRT